MTATDEHDDHGTAQSAEMPRREVTAVDAIADAWVDESAQLFPDLAVWIGRDTGPAALADYSPEGHERAVEARRRVRERMLAAEPVDDVDRVTKHDFLRELDVSLELADTQWHLRDVNVLEDPAHAVRAVFDLMPSESDDDWSRIAERLRHVPKALAGYTRTLRLGVERNVTPAIRQVREAAIHMRRNAAADGFFAELAAQASETSCADEVRRAARIAAEAYGTLAEFLETDLAAHASQADGVGRDLYEIHSRAFLGATVDLDETYEWGMDELARMAAEQEAVAREILPGASVAEAIAHLEADTSRKLHGTEALQRWMQETSDRAIRDLAGVHFDIPDEMRRLECKIAPTQDGAIYYTPPTEDFSRPGRMWWSVPPGVEEFDTWRELTTVYHEGVPGHHLQLGQQIAQSATLNAWRRLMAGVSGHLEGWALYAERLMESLGYLDDPADRLGMLDAQRLRAARVVIDIGVHLGKPSPSGAGQWTHDDALRVMHDNVNMPNEFIEFEVNRYLGWPGQAPSYKIGQRIWEQLRDDVARREGAAFSLRDFHTRALAIGSVGLETLQTAILGS